MSKYLAAMFFIGFGGLFALGSVAWFGVAASQGQPAWALGGVLFLAVGGFVAVLGIRQLLAAAVFQVATVKFRSPARLGDHAQAQLTLIPKRPLALKPGQCKLSLRTVERARYSAGTQSRTYVNTVHEAPVAFDFPNTLELAGVVRELSVPVPRDIPPSWRGSSNSLTTTLALHLAIDQWPDLRIEGELQVLPEVAP